MTLHLSKYVSGGEIINTRNNSIHGYVALRGCDRPIVLQLTGNCSPDLVGRHLKFEAYSDPAIDPEPVTEEQMDELRLGWMQIGVPGEMTIAQYPRLYLEWHGQNGHTVIDLLHPLIEFVDPADDDIDDDADDTPTYDDLEEAEQEIAGMLDDAVDDEDMDVDSSWNSDSEAAEHDDEDPFGLFPPDLNASLGESTSPPWTSEPDEATLAQWKEWDEVFEGTRDVPLSSLFDPPIQLPPEEALSDQQVAELFNVILKQLALHNVAFHMCEHFTPRGGYQLLVNQILREYGIHPELPRIGYTMSFDTSEFCAECAADFDERYGAEQSDTTPEDLDFDTPPDDSSLDDPPF
ncbi:MAG: hypothetical protein JSS49_18450 [Planctomycetes bacterium]|nr:hypothetical protein [Planctomycetota bacterium]